MTICRGPRYYFPDEEPDWDDEEEEEVEDDEVQDRCPFCGVHHNRKRCWRQETYLAA